MIITPTSRCESGLLISVVFLSTSSVVLKHELLVVL
ncbi:hypothetical protein GBAR_LOCUS23972 [Geodia barretti]|uniref:Uncharacterized protein n=1 Tax=Geodia barretti TaxID=519541 RepID=A0AA35T9D1_GEOBA|nr:hypothetical protein GBAR_LOCUS23972 [Geodia barretti]